MKTKKKTPPISSVEISIPSAWEQLTEKQLRYVCFLLLNQYSEIEIKTLCLVRFSKIRIVDKTKIAWICKKKISLFRSVTFLLRNWELEYHIQKLDYLIFPACGIRRFEKIGGYHAVNVQLHDVAFKDYLIAENHYQNYLYTKNIQALTELAKVLYRNKKGRIPKRIKMNEIQKYSVFQWFYQVKMLFSVTFTNFFQSDIQEGEENNMPDMVSIMNDQIRALTGGDITKEEQILNMDTWRALTELDAKAKDYKEFKQQSYGK